MPLSIKNPETERLARALAAATGQSVTNALTMALRRTLEESERSGDHRARALAEGRRLSADTAARWPEELRLVDHGEMLYDDHGLPR